MSRASALFVFAVLSIIAAGASAQTALTCTDNAQGLGSAPGSTLVVTCPAGCGSATIWGTSTYSDDSAVCVAAIHAGVMGTGGGTFQVTIQPGLSAYVPTEANGIVSSAWGSWGRSFSVAAAGTVSIGCGDSAQQLPGSAGTELTVLCPAGCANVGSIWGGPTYSDDSAVCRAAVHAGVLNNGGGSATITIQPGLSAYPSSTANGVTSSEWGAWTRSFTVR